MTTQVMNVFAYPCANVNLRDSNTKIEKFSIQWGIVVANFDLISLKIKIALQQCYQYIANVLF